MYKTCYTKGGGLNFTAAELLLIAAQLYDKTLLRFIGRINLVGLRDAAAAGECCPHHTMLQPFSEFRLEHEVPL